MRERLRPTNDPTPDAPWYWTAAFAVAFFGFTFRLGSPSSGAELDASWAAVLGWAHLHGLRWGHEIVFTYGPLGWLHPKAPYEAALYPAFVAGQVLLGFGYTFLYASLFQRLAVFERLVFAAVALFACRAAPDALMLGAGIVAVVSLDRSAETRRGTGMWIVLAIVALQVNAAGLVKFTAFPIAVALCGVGAVSFAYRRRSQMAFAWTGLWIAALLALWIGSGQQVSDLPAYVHTSLLVAAGHAAAMGVDSSGAILVLGLASLVASGIALLVWWRDEGWRNWRAVVLAGHLALCLWIAWKAGYTRADFWHTRFFFPLAAFVVFALVALRASGRRWWTYATTAAICVASMVVTTVLWVREQPELVYGVVERATGVDAGRMRDAYETLRTRAQRVFDLPGFRARIGVARVDMFGCAQGIVLINDFTYAPRPVFQTYATHTEPLQRINEAYYLGPDAPQFVILKLCTIDGRHPAGDDALALLALMRTYRPLMQEKGYLLLERTPAVALALPTPPEPDVALRLEEWVDVPAGEGPVLVRFDYELSLLGGCAHSCCTNRCSPCTPWRRTAR